MDNTKNKSKANIAKYLFCTWFQAGIITLILPFMIAAAFIDSIVFVGAFVYIVFVAVFYVITIKQTLAFVGALSKMEKEKT